MDTHPTPMSPDEFNDYTENIIRGYMDHGLTRLEALWVAIDELEEYLFGEGGGGYEDNDVYTLYSLMSVFWGKLAEAAAVETLAPVAKA